MPCQTRLRDSRGFTLIELMIVVVIIGILAAIAIPNFARMQDHAKLASVKQNCHTVQIAAEDFSARNDGVYASSTAAVAVDGTSFLDVFPGAQRLANPWSGALTEPVDGVPVQLGSSGYRPIVQGGAAVGYIIEGVGRNGIEFTASNQ